MKTYGRKLNNACKCEFCFNRTFEKDSKTRERNWAKEEIKQELEITKEDPRGSEICCLSCVCPDGWCDADKLASQHRDIYDAYFRLPSLEEARMLRPPMAWKECYKDSVLLLETAMYSGSIQNEILGPQIIIDEDE